MSERTKFTVIVADPPWAFSDKLTMDPTNKRGAEANYSTLTQSDIERLPVEAWAAKDALCALWVPSSLLSTGLSVLDYWGFEHKQIVTWVKTSINTDPSTGTRLAFGMGRYFRGCSEQCLIGTRGKVSKLVQSKSERNVILAPKMPHSQKPEQLQSALERMLPGPYLEMFARRKRKGWTTVGLEVGSGHDLRTWKPSRVK